MSVIQYILESLMVEDQATAKRIANDESTNFSMDDLDTLKNLISPKLYSKSLGWIATNWDDLPHEDIGELINTFFEYSGRKDNNLKHNLNDYKDGKTFVREVKRVLNTIKKTLHKKPEDAYNVIWESEDGKIEIGIPLTKDASVKKGRGAQWCTAADTNRGNTYDTEHMFCHYVLDVRGLMVYIINNNLPDTDKQHKMAIRLMESNLDDIRIREIQDISNNGGYMNDDTWNSKFQEYIDKWDIPMQELIDGIDINNDDITKERKEAKKSDRIEIALEDNNMDKLVKYIDNGYVPTVKDLNYIISDIKYGSEMVEYLLSFKTVKPNRETMEKIYTVDTFNILSDAGKMNPKLLVFTEYVLRNRELVKIYEDLGVPYNDYSLRNALENDDMDRYNKYIEQGAVPGVASMKYAVENDNQKYANIITDYIIKNNVVVDRTMLISMVRTESDAPTKPQLDNIKRIYEHNLVKHDLKTLSIATSTFGIDGLKLFDFTDPNFIKFVTYDNSAYKMRIFAIIIQIDNKKYTPNDGSDKIIIAFIKKLKKIGYDLSNELAIRVLNRYEDDIPQERMEKIKQFMKSPTDNIKYNASKMYSKLKRIMRR